VCISNVPVLATSCTNMILLELIAQIIFDKACKPWRCSWSSFLRPFISFSLLGSNISFSKLLSKILSFYLFFPQRVTKFHTHIKQQATLKSYLLSSVCYTRVRKKKYEGQVWLRNQMVAPIPLVYSAHNFSQITFWFTIVLPKCMQFARRSENLLTKWSYEGWMCT